MMADDSACLVATFEVLAAKDDADVKASRMASSKT